jgi:hypothetical protein
MVGVVVNSNGFKLEGFGFQYYYYTTGSIQTT